MKIIERISLTLFSMIILILSMVIMFVIFGWLDASVISSCLTYVINIPAASNTVMVLLVIFILFAIKCIFFDSASRDKNKIREGVLLENEAGKLLISKDTIESLTESVVKEFESAEDIISKVILNKDNTIRIEIMMHTHPDAIIKDLSKNLQTKIKDTIKKSLGLEVKEINLKIKDIAVAKSIDKE